MADKRDYYEVLGLDKSANQDDIKRAYRAMARKYHPDLNPGYSNAEAKFKELNEANEVLSDSDKKARYDQFGHAGVDSSFGMGGGRGAQDFSEIFDMFGGMFGGGRSASASAPRRGSDIGASVTLTFAEACTGKKVEVSFPKVDKCPDCGGSGAKTSSSVDVCPDCKGQGVIKVTTQTIFGAIMSSTRACGKCGGKGKVIKDPCARCTGAGRIRIQKTIQVDIPAGIDNGQLMKVDKEGDAGSNGGPNGHLILTVSVRPDNFFRRNGSDVYCDIPITYLQAAVGDKITVPTIDGKVEQNIPEGTQTGTVFRFKGKGIKKVGRSDHGDQYVTVNVEIPRNLSKNQKETLKNFDASLDDSNYSKRKSFFEILKEKLRG